MEAAAEKKAADIVLLDLGGLTILTDYFVICDGETDRQVKSIARGIIDDLREQGVRPLSVEGEAESGWMLLDYGDVVVHIFETEIRGYYKLEELWSEAKVVVRML